MVRNNYAGTQITQWDCQNKGKLGWTGTSSFVLEVPLRCLRPSVIYSVPCDWILQRAYTYPDSVSLARIEYIFCLRVSKSILILFFSSSLKRPSNFRASQCPSLELLGRNYESYLSELLSVSFSVLDCSYDLF